MSADIKLIVGLGNPGTEYQATRHNAGTWFVQQLAEQYNIQLKPDQKASGLLGKGTINGQDIVLLVPTTFMNRSGTSVAAIAKFYKWSAEQILVAHDELDLPVGTAKFKQGGGHGGQNGLRDIISKLDNQKTFHRLRVGIGHPGHRDLVTGHVLGRPPIAERQRIDDVLFEALSVMPDWLTGNQAKAMNRLHSYSAN